MVTIIFIEENGVSQVVDEITKLVNMGMLGDSDAQQLAKYIRQGLTQLENVGLPSNKNLIMTGYEEDGNPRTFNLLKSISSDKPLFEFRVNRSIPGAFRAVFFEYFFEGDQFLIFTRALLKKGVSNPPELQVAIQESEQLYTVFIRNPLKYIIKGE